MVQAHAVIPVDLTRLLGRFTEIAELVNHGESGLPALQLIVEVAQEATAAAGATFVEYGRSSGGRAVAASGELTWSVGRRVEPSRPETARLVTLPGVRSITLGELNAESASQLRGRGLRWIVGTNVTSGGMAVVGPGGIVRSWNPAAARLTARNTDDAVGRPLFFPVPGRGEVVEHQMSCGKWIEARSAALAGTDAMVVTFRERPDASAQEEARDLFIALTSHELRTQVTVIRGYADTLVEHWDNLDETARREAVFVVGARARDLARLVDRLLTAASDLSGTMGAAVFVPFDLAEALRAATGELTAELRRDLRLRLPAGLPKVIGDRTTLATVVTELVTNACKYSTGRVDVELTAGADAQTVWFRVADRGVGIRPEHVERAFERFWQLETGDQRRYGGVGLGLYLVRRIVERQRGWVSLRPREGGGSVAEVRLPRADVSPGEA